MSDQSAFDVYQRFRRAVAAVAESRRRFAPEIAARDWVVRCYESQLEFEARFPELEARRELVTELEDRLGGLVEQLSASIARAIQFGLSDEARAALSGEDDNAAD